MPINERADGWYWGSKGPFNSRTKAEEIQRAAYASGYKKLMKEQTDKIEKSEAGYRHATPEEIQSHVMCGTCDHYNNDETCELVEGTFHSEDYCKLFKPGGMNKFIKFQKNFATTSSTGASTGGPSYFNATYGDTGPAKKRKPFRNATHDLTKGAEVNDEQTMFTSTETFAEAFGKPKRKTKDKSGVDRVNEFLEDYSPDMGAMKYEKAYGESHSGLVKVSPGQNAQNERRQSRRVLNRGGRGGGANTTSSKTMSTTPDHSHATTLLGKTTLIGKNEADVIINSNFTTDLIKWVSEQFRLEKEGRDPYGVRLLDNESNTRVMRGGDQPKRTRKNPKTPTTETSVPDSEVHYPNMGQEGGVEAGIATHDPAGAENPANMTDYRLADKGRHVGKKNSNEGGAFIAQPNQGGFNVMGMEKGTPHVFSISQPMHGGEAEQTKPYIEGKSELEEKNTEDDVEERTKEKRKRDRKDAEPGMDGPSIDDAGSIISDLGSPLTSKMEKQGFDYEVDALHRGGSLDDTDDELPTDEDNIEHSLRQKELKNLQKFIKMVSIGERLIGK